MWKLEQLSEKIEKIGESAEVSGKNFGNFNDIYRMFEENRRRLWEIEEKATQIEYLTSYTLDDLLDKFAAGWVLVKPEIDNLSMSEFAESLEKGD